MFYEASFLISFLTFTVVKEKLQEYCTTVYFRSGVNEMLILKTLKNNKKKQGHTILPN